MLGELAGVAVDTKQVERTAAEALGREVAGAERVVAESEPGAAPTMYLGLDGTGVPVAKVGGGRPVRKLEGLDSRTDRVFGAGKRASDIATGKWRRLAARRRRRGKTAKENWRDRTAG